jgi:hypothetical protein
MKWADLVKRSTMKSIQMFSHFHSGMLKGCRFSVSLK